MYEVMKVAFGSCIDKVASLKSRAEEVTNDCSKLMDWWAEYYKNLHLTENIVSDTVHNNTPALPTIEELDLSPTEDELSKAINSLDHGKA